MIEQKILDLLSKTSCALSIIELSDILQEDRNLVFDAMMRLKNKGAVTQPKRCYWTVY